MIDSCIGIDPGPTTGMCFLDYISGHLVGKTLLQCDGGSAAVILKSMLYANYGHRNMHEVPGVRQENRVGGEVRHRGERGHPRQGG